MYLHVYMYEHGAIEGQCMITILEVGMHKNT